MDEKNDENILKIVDKLAIPLKYKTAFIEKNYLRADKLFSTPISVFSFQLHVPIDICNKILSTVAEKLVPSLETVETLIPKPRFNDMILDQSILLPDSGIIEIVGKAGSGKSNLIYQLAVNSRIEDMTRPVIIISTEGRIPTARLEQIAQGANSMQYTANEIMCGILIHQVETVEELQVTVNDYLPPLFLNPESPKPSLVIIDSIAALFRIEYDCNAAPARTRILFDISTTLKWLSSAHKALILVTNQATANMDPYNTFASNDWIPALGFSWSNCLNVRMRITKTHMIHEIRPKNDLIRTNPGLISQNEKVQTAPVRTIYVEISPILQDVKCEFYIDNDGIHGM